jgi:hypothetical protein
MPIVTIPAVEGMWVSGWAVSTQTEHGPTVFAPFESAEEAFDWANKLDNAVIFATYYATTNMG